MELTDSLPVLAKLGLAGLLGGLIGLERELHGQAAGLRTHMVVATASCLLMLVSIHVSQSFGDKAHPPDPGRIAAQVVAGIGFLGAGAILRFGLTVRGLTTAACIWAAAAIGLAVGVDYMSGALGCTLIVLIAIFVFDKIEKFLLIGRSVKKLVIVAADTADLTATLESKLQARDVHITNMGIHRDMVDKKIRLEVTVTCGEGTSFDGIARDITSIAGVERLDLE